MKRPVFMLLSITASVVLAPAAQAQHSPSPAPKAQTFTLEDRKAFYEDAKLDVSTAVVRTLILPGLGNFYAEQYFTGVLMMSAFTVGVLSLIYGVANDLTDANLIGGLFILGSYSVGIGLSYYGVEAYNDDLMRRYNLKTSGLDQPRTLNVTMRF